MATITLKGNEIHTVGDLPSLGSTLGSYVFMNHKLEEVKTQDLKGQKLLFNIFPSIDTGVCAASVRRFNQEAGNLENTQVLCVSEDLPFAHARFCGAEGIDKVHSLSTVKQRDFGKTLGLAITDGPLEGLLSRAVIITDSTGKVVYTQQVPEIGQEPDYEKALAALKKAQ